MLSLLRLCTHPHPADIMLAPAFIAEIAHRVLTMIEQHSGTCLRCYYYVYNIIHHTKLLSTDSCVRKTTTNNTVYLCTVNALCRHQHPDFAYFQYFVKLYFETVKTSSKFLRFCLFIASVLQICTTISIYESVLRNTKPLVASLLASAHSLVMNQLVYTTQSGRSSFYERIYDPD